MNQITIIRSSFQHNYCVIIRTQNIHDFGNKFPDTKFFRCNIQGVQGVGAPHKFVFEPFTCSFAISKAFFNSTIPECYIDYL